MTPDADRSRTQSPIRLVLIPVLPKVTVSEALNFCDKLGRNLGDVFCG
jgi:hypothetical protein